MLETNRDALRRFLAEWPEGGSPDLCEWDPLRDMPARLKDRYHGVASVRMVATVDGEPCHVCINCADTTPANLLIRADVPVNFRPAAPGHVRLCGGAS